MEVCRFDACALLDPKAKARAIGASRVDAGREPEAVVDMDLDERAVDENVHVQRLRGAVGKLVGVVVAQHGVVCKLGDGRGARAVDADGVVAGVVRDDCLLLVVGRLRNHHASGAGEVGKRHLEMHVAGAVARSSLGVVAVNHLGLRLVESLDNLGQRSSAQRVSGKSTVCMLNEAGVALGAQLCVVVDQVASLDDVHLSGNGHGTLVALLGKGIVVVLLVGPAPLNAAVVLGVQETGHGVKQSRVDGTASKGSKLNRAVLALVDLSLVPETPLRTGMPSQVATLSAHEHVVVDIIILVGQGEEV